MPKISVLVVIYRMSRQAENTLRSLSPRYQRGIAAGEYEIVVVENSSDDELGRERAKAIAKNIRYFYREETAVSPVPAFQQAVSQARGDVFGIIIDGAHMVTPGVLGNVQSAFRMDPDAVVAVPGYHIGEGHQDKLEDPKAFLNLQESLLRGIDWFYEGYKLFNIGCWSPANPRGYLTSFQECNCLFASRRAYEAAGGVDDRFDMEGGGSVNLELFAALVSRRREARLFVLPGEGSFHQYHDGVTTAPQQGREERLVRQKEQHAEIIGQKFEGVNREPVMLGKVRGPARRFLDEAARHANQNYMYAHEHGKVRFPLDPASFSAEEQSL